MTAKTGFIAVDFDGTLCHDSGYPITGLPSNAFIPDAEVTGAPIQPMVDRVNALRAAGYEVRILTARTVFEPVHAWLIKHLGYDLAVSNVKEHGMLAFFDDRAIRVCRNEGTTCGCYMNENDVRDVRVSYFRWIPEAPKYGGVYAVEPRNGLIFDGEPGRITCTHDVHSALQFNTKEACQAWCDANPTPVFVPCEHGFAG